MKTLTNKISFHIPGFKYIEGKMLNIYLDDFKAVLNKELEKVGIEAFYAVKAVGYYKGREYPQEIITVFFDKEDVLGCFAHASLEREKHGFFYSLGPATYMAGLLLIVLLFYCVLELLPVGHSLNHTVIHWSP